jgi:hypothetical protein
MKLGNLQAAVKTAAAQTPKTSNNPQNEAVVDQFKSTESSPETGHSLIKRQNTLSEAELAKWDSMKSNGMQCPATLHKMGDDGTYHLDGVRWGYEETGNDTSQWKPIFKQAQVNPKDVKEVYIAVEPFAPEWVAGHGEAVVEFNNPIVSQDGEQDNRLVFSVEAWTPKGDSYGIMKGMKKNFGIIHQLGTFGGRVQRQCRKEGRSIILHRLNLTQEQKEAFVKNSLEEAVKDHTGEYYNTATNSCFSSQVVELNKVLPESRQMHRWTALLGLPRMSATLPGTAGLVLERYHLTTPEAPIEIGPDTNLYPNKAPKPLGVVQSATQNRYWGTGCRAAGAALGATVAGQFSGVAGMVLGGLVGSYVAGLAGDHARILNSNKHESPDAYYPNFVKNQFAPEQQEMPSPK